MERKDCASPAAERSFFSDVLRAPGRGGTALRRCDSCPPERGHGASLGPDSGQIPCVRGPWTVTISAVATTCYSIDADAVWTPRRRNISCQSTAATTPGRVHRRWILSRFCRDRPVGGPHDTAALRVCCTAQNHRTVFVGRATIRDLIVPAAVEAASERLMHSDETNEARR
jgi:hypothetical protein